MASREEDIARIADRMREQMLGKLPPDQRAAREAELNRAMGQGNGMSGTISPDSDVTPEVRNMRELLSKGQATMRVPEGTPPELAAAMQKQFAAGKSQQQAPKDFFTDMATQLYNNPVTRAAFIGSEQERASVIGQEAARQLSSVARQMEVLGQRPVQGKPDAGVAATEEQIRSAPGIQGAIRRNQPEVAAMTATLEAYKKAGPEMARRLPGLIGGILSGNSEYAKPERAERGPNDVPPIDGTKLGVARATDSVAPRPDLAAITANVRANLQNHVQAGDPSPAAQAAMRAQELILKMNAQSMAGPAMSRQKSRE